ncbi:MAG TPA: c-type cytochrome [Roseiarcus sp.]|nr:c-type cytochrome [Roseiarcus sp.]
MRRLVALAAALLFVAGCEREKRDLRTDPPTADALDDVAPMPDRISGAPPDVYVALDGPYQNNAYQLSQGKRLYHWFNCNGCHAEGGGAVGPAFMDGWWRYGPDPISIYLSIRDGRPHGMPAFGPKLTTDQIWQLAGYIQTIGSYSPKTAAPSRDDAMQARPAENRGPAAANIPSPSRSR